MSLFSKLIEFNSKPLNCSILYEKIFSDICGCTDLKKEFAKALGASSPVGILLCGPSGCGKSEFLKQTRSHFEDESVFIDGIYGRKAGIFQILYVKRPKDVLLDEIDKLSCPDQLALLNQPHCTILCSIIKVS